MKSELVEIQELVTRPDGTIGLGGTFLVTKEEARIKILNEEALAVGYARGVIPREWNFEEEAKENGVN